MRRSAGACLTTRPPHRGTHYFNTVCCLPLKPVLSLGQNTKREEKMTNPESVTLGLAFLAGLASFLSPCVLALVPIYIGYLSGRSTHLSARETDNKWVTFSHGLAFVVGFSLVFVALGTTVSALGTLLFDIREWLLRIGGLVVVVFGLHTMRVIHLSILDLDKRLRFKPHQKVGYMHSAMMGVFFSAGWTPCVGPVLGAVLLLALGAGEVTRGAVLLSAYSAGMAIPFLFTALGVGWAAGMMKRFGKVIRTIEVATGAFLVFLGIMMVLGFMESVFARWAGMSYLFNFGL